MTKKKELQEIKPQVALRKWSVNLKFLPERVVEAYTAREAYDVYKKMFGIISSAYDPVIKVLTDMEAANVV
jgi:hypothetical protein